MGFQARAVAVIMILDWNILSDFFIYKYFLPSFESILLLLQEKKRSKIDFQVICHLRFRTVTVVTTFDLQVTQVSNFE